MSATISSIEVVRADWNRVERLRVRVQPFLNRIPQARLNFTTILGPVILVDVLEGMDFDDGILRFIFDEFMQDRYRM